MIFTAIGAQAQSGYKTATEKVKIGGKNIVVSGNIYVNLMPMVFEESQKNIDCSKSGNLIAPATIETEDEKKLPTNLEIKKYWIKNNGIWLSMSFNKDETETKANSIYSVARTCPNDKFNVDIEIVAVVELKYKGKSYFVRSSQTKLFTTH